MSRKSKSRREQEKRAAKQAQSQSSPNAAPTPTEVKESNTFQWDLSKERAAHLLAEDHITKTEIAATIGITLVSLWRWEQIPEFAARVAEHQRHLANYSKRYMIARRGYRLSNLQKRLLAMEQVIAERAADPAHAKAPGGKTGLLVRRERMIGSGENAKPVEEFAFDAALVKEMREHEEQAAQECGQRVTKIAPTNPDGTDEYTGAVAPDIDAFRKLSVAERIRLLGSPVRTYLPS